MHDIHRVSSPDNPCDAGKDSMIMSVVELVESMHPVCAIIGNRVIYNKYLQNSAIYIVSMQTIHASIKKLTVNSQ
jgi:hypothetical protein